MIRWGKCQEIWVCNMRFPAALSGTRGAFRPRAQDVNFCNWLLDQLPPRTTSAAFIQNRDQNVELWRKLLSRGISAAHHWHHRVLLSGNSEIWQNDQSPTICATGGDKVQNCCVPCLAHTVQSVVLSSMLVTNLFSSCTFVCLHLHCGSAFTVGTCSEETTVFFPLSEAQWREAPLCAVSSQSFSFTLSSHLSTMVMLAASHLSSCQIALFTICNTICALYSHTTHRGGGQLRFLEIRKLWNAPIQKRQKFKIILTRLGGWLGNKSRNFHHRFSFAVWHQKTTISFQDTDIFHFCIESKNFKASRTAQFLDLKPSSTGKKRKNSGTGKSKTRRSPQNSGGGEISEMPAHQSHTGQKQYHYASWLIIFSKFDCLGLQCLPTCGKGTCSLKPQTFTSDECGSLSRLISDAALPRELWKHDLLFPETCAPLDAIGSSVPTQCSDSLRYRKATTFNLE